MSWLNYKPDPAASREDSGGDFGLVGGVLAALACFGFVILCIVMVFLG